MMKNWNMEKNNKKEKKKLNGHTYKQMLKSLARTKKSKGSDLSIKKTEPNVTDLNCSNEDETTNPDSSASRTERVDFLLRRVRSSGHAERSNSSSDATEANERKNSISESQSNLDNISKLTEKLAHCENECKSMTTNFLEYWVPVKLSNVQTEQYCGSLFSNANLLRSYTKLGSTEKLHDILVSTRQCCDHPYLVDRSLRTSLIQGIPQLEQLDAEIKLSNKLLLLHKILLEIKKRGLRVLLLYQSLGGSGQISTGDVLDDIIHEKFGVDSFIRIDGWISRIKRKDTLNTFNQKGSGKFVCLMETRFCLPSMKLSSVDTVIFFNSDWDPMNDLRALQRINLDSQFAQVKVFRLYSSYTVEEKALILSKQGLSPEGNVMNIKQSTCHELLTWGVSYLLKKLDEFHASTASDADSVMSNEGSFVENVFVELSSLLPNSGESSVCTKNTLILEVQQIGGVYTQNISLLGEVESPLMDDISSEPPCYFWIKLLEGRNPRWKYFSSQSPRIRKSFHHFDDLPEEPAEVGTETARKKCRTEGTSTVPQKSTVIRRRKNTILQKDHKRRKLSGGKECNQQRHKFKSDLREKIASWINRQRKASVLARVQTPTLGNPSSAEQQSELPPNEPDHPLPEAAGLLPEDLIRPLESSQNSGNCQLPEASQGTHSEALQSACKALQIELERLEKERAECFRQHEDMNLQTKTACEKEIDEIRKKYDTQLQKAEVAFMEKKEAIETRYNKIYINKSLAEAVMQTDTSKDATLTEGLCSGVFMQASTVEDSNQTSASATIASGSNQSCVIPCPNVLHPMPSLEVGPFRSSVAARTNQSLAIPCIDAPQLMPNLPTNFSRNLLASCQLRAPAPHLRNVWRPLPVTAPKTSNAQQPLS